MGLLGDPEGYLPACRHDTGVGLAREGRTHCPQCFAPVTQVCGATLSIEGVTYVCNLRLGHGGPDHQERIRPDQPAVAWTWPVEAVEAPAFTRHPCHIGP